MSNHFPRIRCAGEGALLLELSDRIDMEVNLKLHRIRESLMSKPRAGLIECVVAYSSMAVYYDPLVMDVEALSSTIMTLLNQGAQMGRGQREVVHIPVCYGGEMGPDIETVASHTGLSEDEVVRRHSSREYYCYMVGFTPGFPYLGGMDESLETPRLKIPRKCIPAGSVGIAGKQTGVYPIESPGGWQLIGRTPLKLFDPSREEPTLIRAGDFVRFVPIDLAEFQRISKEVMAGTYRVKRQRGGEEA